MSDPEARAETWSERIISFALDNRAAVLFLTAVITVWGYASFRALTVEAFPDPTDTQVNVITLYPGQPAEEIERQVGLDPIVGIWQRLLQLRSPAMLGRDPGVSATDRPFQSAAVGILPASDPQAPGRGVVTGGTGGRGHEPAGEVDPADVVTDRARPSAGGRLHAEAGCRGLQDEGARPTGPHRRGLRSDGGRSATHAPSGDKE